ncbi:Gfo/Idh/MocA family protein [Acidaminobacter hydrogenoformans]|uniref:Predicted dehydrogenase n=1 Tax=Acidaminobacter hydrogenoformans DSM 2784 TaxID=1120920 RepID=A0A1G5RZD8_9FIRM|nr:Gfo/Idh/MocA family oxidoreductase [Acidaminobacter hydrogenoformans]SCZ79484.1 Predicted dehydrogenase [Acidaminobacter hydrogenoformans DSM 2784]
MAKKEITIALIGGGYGAILHLNGYEKIHGVEVRLKALVDVDVEKANALKEKYGIEQVLTDYQEVLRDPEIDIVDIVTPPSLHPKMVYEAMKAGKHVICEKPFTGYFGEAGDPELIGKNVSKRQMFEAICRELDKGKKIVEASGRLFMYAENFVYAPNLRKAAELIAVKGSRILFMKGEASLRGSSSPVAGQWSKTGGGPLMRNAIHPLTGMLWLKRTEAASKGEEIKVVSVTADASYVVQRLTEAERRHLNANPVDVEDNITVTMTFSDGTKALVIGSDTYLGGTKTYVDVYANDATFNCNVAPTDYLQTYFLDEAGIEDVYLAEMLPNKLGWNRSFVSDEVLRGYTGELQDFVECVAFGRKPVSDYELAAESVKLIYAAYLSAEEGRRIDL